MVDVYTYTSLYTTMSTKIDDICKRCHFASTKIRSNYHESKKSNQDKLNQNRLTQDGAKKGANFDDTISSSLTSTSFTRRNNLSIANKVILSEGLMIEDINAGKWIICILIAIKFGMIYLSVLNSLDSYFHANAIANERKDFYSFVGEYNEDIARSLLQDVESAAPILVYIFK